MRKMIMSAATVLSAVAMTSVPAMTQAVQIDENIPAYVKTSGVSGSLNSEGSDTLNNLMTFWAEGFRTQYPNVKVQIQGKGSSTAPPALIKGTAQLGPMSRPMKASELDEFEEAYGYKPTAIAVAIDALAVYVHKDNPIDKLTYEQIDAVFSSTRKCGANADVVTWGDLGATGNWANRPISVYGRNSASGTYGYFKKHALCGGDYKDSVKEQPGSASVVQGITTDLYGIGYSGIGYKTSGVNAIDVAKNADSPFYSTGMVDVMSGKYPLSRFLYVYVNKAPNQPVDPLIREFVRFVLSQEGQETVVKDGYLPMTTEMVEKQLAMLD